VVRGFRVRRDEAIHAAQEDDRDHRQRRGSGEAARGLEEQHRQEHERDVVHDIVNPPAVDVRQDLFHAKAARQHAVGRIHEGRREHRGQRQAIVAVHDAPCADEGEDRPHRGIRVDQPGALRRSLGLAIRLTLAVSGGIV
jgi:hypothetical protein